MSSAAKIDDAVSLSPATETVDLPAFGIDILPTIVDALRIDDAAVVTRGDADDLPPEVEAIGGFFEQRHESPRDVAMADEREVGEHRGSLPPTPRRTGISLVTFRCPTHRCQFS